MGEIELRKLELLPGGFARESISYGEVSDPQITQIVYGICVICG